LVRSSEHRVVRHSATPAVSFSPAD